MPLTTRLRAMLSDAKDRAAAADSNTATPADGSKRGQSAGESATSLFECTSCDSVYVAVEKSTCTDCDATVEEVAATLSPE